MKISRKNKEKVLSRPLLHMLVSPRDILGNDLVLLGLVQNLVEQPVPHPELLVLVRHHLDPRLRAAQKHNLVL